MIHTHESAADVLRSAVPGAVVHILPVWPPDAASRRYLVRLPQAPEVDTGAIDAYSLPCAPGPLVRRVRELADKALAATRRKDGIRRV